MLFFAGVDLSEVVESDWTPGCNILDVIVLLFHVKNVRRRDVANRTVDTVSTIVEYLGLLLLLSVPPLLMCCLLCEPIIGEPTVAPSPGKRVRRACSGSLSFRGVGGALGVCRITIMPNVGFRRIDGVALTW